MITGLIKNKAEKNQKIIRLAVKDEQTLYTPFSPADEFCRPVKLYIKSKLSGGTRDQRIKMIVLSQKRLDEDRFHRAVSNWIRDEKEKFNSSYHDTILKLVGLLIAGSILIILCLGLQTQFSVLKHSLLPIMGTLALTKAGGILLIDLPTGRAVKWMIDNLESNDDIVFEYTADQ